MSLIYDDKPIIACSTSMATNAALSVIRVSGVEKISSLNPFFDFDLTDLEPNYAKFCKIKFNDKIYDEIVLTYFKGPKSFNGENILELSVHGNIHNVNRILDLFISNSEIRHAKPGEFSYRALKNNKLSLSQVEGLDALLNASSSSMLDQGLDLLNGELFKRYLKLRDLFISVKSNLELNIDFAEDVGDEQGRAYLEDSIDKLGLHIKSLFTSSTINKKQFLSPSIVLFGKPNAGKSTLFNSLLKTNRAIVSDIEGTTRDFITEYLDVSGNTFKLIDTAGIRLTDNLVESEGVKRAKELIEDSFLKLCLVNLNNLNLNDVNFKEIDLLIFTHAENVESESFNTLYEKIDVPFLFSCLNDGTIKFSNVFGPMGAIENNFGPIEPDSHFSKFIYSGPIEPLKLKEQTGSIEPISLISECISNKFNYLSSFDPILIDRQRTLIDEISRCYDNFVSISKQESDVGIISSELTILDNKISQLIGIVTPDNVLQNIFSNFCIGK